MRRTDKKAVIAGAGVAGLTVAYQLSCAGWDVLVVEKEGSAGGLAKSFRYDGFVFDIGPHRFHTEIPEVLDFIYDVLLDDYVEIERKSGVWMFGRYFDWPLASSSVFKMPFPVLFSVGMDFLKRNVKSGRNFEEYIISKYGETLYKTFFKPYTEKFLGMPCHKISLDWAVTGIDRAVIDKKIKMDDLQALFNSLLLKQKPLKFIYPKSGGISVFAENLVLKIMNNGGAVFVNSEITEIIRDNGLIKSVFIGGKKCECDVLVWTGPISEILHLCGGDATALEYRAMILFNYRLDHGPLVDYQWCYYGSADIPFNRISTPSLLNPLLAPPGKTGICAEVTCMRGDPIWQRPEIIETAIRKALVDIGVARDYNAIVGLNIERVANAYPIYAMDYEDKLRAAKEQTSELENLELLGRSGSFWYNNMDQSINAALELSKKIAYRL